jgi:arylsulfatase
MKKEVKEKMPSALRRAGTWAAVGSVVGSAAIMTAAGTDARAAAAGSKPNIVMLISDDTGWGDLGIYGGGVGRGMATPNLDRMAEEGMHFWSFYGQPSCTPGRAAMQTGRIPNRSGMTTVAFQGQGGGLPWAEWTLASVLKKAGYSTFFVGKWHLGEDDYAMPVNQGYDEMRNVTLYHLNAYTYCSSKWNPDMSAETLAMFQKTTKGVLEGEASADGKHGTVKTVIPGKDVWEKIPLLDQYTEDATIKYLEEHAKDSNPFFMSINFAKNHQPNIPAPDFVGKSAGKSKYSDSVVELDTRIGRIMDKIRELGIDKDTLVFYTVDNGAWQDVYPDAGYTPFRGTKGTDREGGSLVPAIARWPGTIPARLETHSIAGGLDLMATFAALAGLDLPTKDRDGVPIIFDSVDLMPLMTGKKDSVRDEWFYFTEDELTPGAVRLGRWKAVFNLRGDDGAETGGLAVDSNLGWKGPSKYVAVVPQIFDLWADPQERYDIYMNNFTEKTWTIIMFNNAISKLVETYQKYPPRKMQSASLGGPMTIDKFRMIEKVKAELKERGYDLKK